MNFFGGCFYFFYEKKKQIFERFFDFLRPAFGHGHLGHPQSLEYLGNFYFFTKKNDFRAIFRLFTASVWSRPPGPPAVPGVLITIIILLQFFSYNLFKYYIWQKLKDLLNMTIN